MQNYNLIIGVDSADSEECVRGAARAVVRASVAGMASGDEVPG
jgi:hypothetical protein